MRERQRRQFSRVRRSRGAAQTLPAPALSFRAENQVTSSAVAADGAPVTAWSSATTTSGTPRVVTDSIAGGPAIRTSSTDKLLTAAGAGGFLSKGPSTAILVWRARKYNVGGSYTIVDTTEGGTVAGYQITAYDNNADIFSIRVIAVRIFDGTSWILDKPAFEQWGHFITEKWHVITVRVSGTRWEIRVDGKATQFAVQTVALSFPASATGRLAIGGGASDYKQADFWASDLPDATVAALEARAANYGVDMILPVQGLINIVNLPTPRYVAFPWAMKLPGGVISVTSFDGHDEAPADANYITEQFSIDGGHSYSNPVTIYQSNATTRYADPHTLLMSNGQVLRVVYTYDGAGIGKKIWHHTSTDGLQPYSALTEITGLSTSVQIQLGGAPVEDPNNPGHIFFASYEELTSTSDPGWNCYLYKSVDYGATWTRPAVIANGVTDVKQYAEPQLMFTSTAGEILCLIRDYTGGGAGGMKMSRSTDGGATWAAVTAQLLNANSAGQSFFRSSSGRDHFLCRPSATQTLAWASRPPGSAWNAAWNDVPVAPYIDPRPAEMVYGATLEVSTGRFLHVWGAFTGNAPNTVSDVSARFLDEWLLTRQMPGTITPSGGNVIVGHTQPLQVTGAGDYTFAITADTTGGASVSPAGVVTAGPNPGSVTAGATDINGYQRTVTFTVIADPNTSITSVYPDAGTAAGGTTLTIKGNNFDSGATVTVGGVSVTKTFIDAHTMTVTAPALTASSTAYDVVVVATAGTATSTGAYSALPTSLVRHYDAGAGITLDVSNNVQTIADQTGNENLTQLALANRPSINAAGINGKAAIVNTSSTVLVGGTTPPATTAITLCAVTSSTSTLEGRILGMQYNAFHTLLAQQATSGKAIYNTADATTAVSDNAVNDGNPHALMATWSTADNTARVYVDGTVASATTAASSTAIAAGGPGDCNCLGGAANSNNGVVFNSFPGKIAVGLVFNAALNSSDRTIVMAYLKRRGGIP